jgi:hypothetical protein
MAPPCFCEDCRISSRIICRQDQKTRKGNKRCHFSDPSQPLLSPTAALHKAEDNPASVFLPDADLAWHVRAWGRWVLERAKADLAAHYPVIDGEPTVAYLVARTARDKEEPFRPDSPVEDLLAL